MHGEGKRINHHHLEEAAITGQGQGMRQDKALMCECGGTIEECFV